MPCQTVPIASLGRCFARPQGPNWLLRSLAQPRQDSTYALVGACRKCRASGVLVDVLCSAMDVRVMRPDEYTSVRTLSVSTFDDDTIGGLLDDLHDSWAWEDSLSFVALMDNELIGHVLYSRGFVDAPTRILDVLVLSPVAVAPQHQRRGVGGDMITRTLEQLEGRPEPLVFLEGSPRYYPRFGFESASSLGFTSPSERIPDAAFMVRLLPKYEPWMRGRLVYSDAFWRNDAVGLRDQPQPT